MDENEHILLDVVGLYCFILALVGTFGNLVCSYVCFSHRLRGMTTFVFLGCMLIADTVCLYVWCFDHFVERYFRKSEAKTSAILCRFEVFVQFVSLETSSWLLVAISVDRWLNLQVKAWRMLYFKSSQALLISLCIFAIVCVINAYCLIFTGNFDIDGSVVGCYLSKNFSVWQKVNSFVYSFIPMITLMVVNFLLLKQTLKKSHSFITSSSSTTTTTNTNMVANANNNTSIRTKSFHSIDSNKHINKKKIAGLFIFAVAYGFMLATTPHAIINGFFSTQILKTNTGKLVLWLFDSLTFTYHSLKFELILIFNRKFRLEMKSFLFGMIVKSSNSLGRKSIRIQPSMSITDASS